MIWDYKTKRCLHEKVVAKLVKMHEGHSDSFVGSSIYDPTKWNEYLDALGCTRILRTKTGWDYEDEKTPRSEQKNNKKHLWRSINTPGYVHVHNPMWQGNFDHSEHVIRIPKHVAEKILIIGFP